MTYIKAPKVSIVIFHLAFMVQSIVRAIDSFKSGASNFVKDGSGFTITTDGNFIMGAVLTVAFGYFAYEAYKTPKLEVSDAS